MKNLSLLIKKLKKHERITCTYCKKEYEAPIYKGKDKGDPFCSYECTEKMYPATHIAERKKKK